MVHPSEMLALVLFCGVVLFVIGASAWETFAWLRGRLRKDPPPGPRRRWYRRAVLSLAALGVLCMAWGRFVEPFWPEVVHVRIESRKLAPGARPVRIVHLSDLHCDPSPRLEERLPALVAAEKPDLIVFTGDCVNSPPGLPLFRRTMESLVRIAPVFGVKGNWDVWYFRDLERFDGTGARALDGTSAVVDAGGTPVRVAGLAYGHDALLGAALRDASPEEFTVLLYHTPDLAETPPRPDLHLCGHTHGGQVRLPLYGAVVTLSRFGKRYEAGLYDLGGGTRLYVNRGIGMEGHRAPRVRFLCRPEIAVLEIVPAPR